jgi:transcriptional regulator with XRE-family HTH domain
MTFGRFIYMARKKKQLNLRDLAALIKKEDGSHISFQYINDIENNRRKPPPDFIMNQFAEVLEIPPEILYFRAKRYPPGLNENANQEKIIEAFRLFKETLQ